MSEWPSLNLVEMIALWLDLSCDKPLAVSSMQPTVSEVMVMRQKQFPMPSPWTPEMPQNPRTLATP